MELFNEIKSYNYKELQKAINNYIINGEALENENLQEIINENPFIDEKFFQDEKMFTWEDGEYLPNFKGEDCEEREWEGIPYLLTNLEKRYLKTLLNYSWFCDLLGEDIVETMEDELCNFHPFDFDVIVEKKLVTRLDKIDTAVFWEICNAIIKGKKIILDNIAIHKVNNNHDAYKRRIVTPYKILYNGDRNMLQLMFLAEDNQVKVANLENLRNVEIVDDLAENIDTVMKETDRKRRTVEIQVNEFYTSVERTFLLFSNYDREAWYDGKDTYHLKVYYYAFEEKVIIKKILSLGHAVVVQGPYGIQKKIVDRISKIE